MKKRFLPLCMLLITMVLAQASIVANAAGVQGKYNPRTGSKATISSFMKSIRANQETGLIDPALVIAARKTAQTTTKDANYFWGYAGPDNFGGLTRAVVYDKEKNLIIGTMGGDVYKTTNNGITFRRLTNLNLTISCMVMNEEGDLFIGTGDGRNAQTLNGLSDLGYETSFVGEGIYKMAAGTTELELLSGTSSWSFVNEMTIANGKIYAATSEGLMVSDNNGQSWSKVLDGCFRSIKSNDNGDVLAADTVNVFLMKNGESFNNISTGMPANTCPKIIAMAPTNPEYMYIAYQNVHTLASTAGGVTEYYTGDIYFTNDGGETWLVALAQTNMYPIFGTNSTSVFNGLYEPNGVMAVYPNDPTKVLIGYDNLWLLEDVSGLGANSYRPTQVSVSGTSLQSFIYLHQGIQNIVFFPSKPNTTPNTFYVGTNGGIFRGKYLQGYYRFTNCNRYFITDDQHCSPTRMMAVGVGGTNKVIGGCLDHGTIRIDREENVNNVTTGIAIFPNPDEQTNANQQYGYYDPAFAGGPCAISTINPNIMFVTGTGALSTPLHRTESNGEDYDLTKFLGGSDPVITNSGVFRTPFAFYENYDDPHSSLDIYEYRTVYDTTGFVVYDSMQYVIDTTGGVIDTVESIHIVDTVYNIITSQVIDTITIDFDTLVLGIRDTLRVGDSCLFYSNQGGYPIDMLAPALPDSLVNPAHLNGQIWLPKDTIYELHDPLSSIMVVGIADKVYLTRYSLIFNKDAEWLLLGKVKGTPSAVSLSGDGEFALVGTTNGKLYKFPKLGDIYVSEQVDTTNVLNYIYSDVPNFLVTEFPSQAITSIAIDPTDGDKVVVTLGNYASGNKYVYRTTNGSTFEAVAGAGLPASPVYSSVIEKDSKNIIVGTEFGIYVSENNGASWTKSGEISCPVMDIKQAIVPNHPDKVVKLLDEMGVPTYITYPGVSNCGMIYAATYGEGIIVCDPEADNMTNDDNNNTAINGDNVEHLNVYPNPVRNNAQVALNLDSDANVSYVIYDLSGRMIVNVDLGTYTKGTHSLPINTAALSNGSYIIKVQAGDKTESTKFLVY